MLEVVKDVKRLLPGLPGLRQITDGVASVTEVGQSDRFVEAVAEFPEVGEGALVAGGCLSLAAPWKVRSRRCLLPSMTT
jgi:hypothetical protein